MADPVGSGSVTRRMIAAYLETAMAPTWLASFFSSPRRNFHNSAEVELDIERDNERVAVVVEDLSSGYRWNANDPYTNRAIVPPIYREGFTLNSHDLLKRNPGQDPFQNPSFRANVIDRVYRGMTKLERKVRRALELQAAQILQTGQLDLKDEDGVTRYTVNYGPKATHFANAGTAWSNNASTPLANIAAMAEVIRNDGLITPNVLIMGESAFVNFVKHEDVQAHYNNRRIEQGRISSMRENDMGAQFRGMVEYGVYRFELWTYNGKYRNEFKAGVSTTDFYIDTDHVVVMNPASRLDATFGGVPNIGRELGATSVMSRIPELPMRIRNVEGGMDLHTNAWLTDGGENLNIGISARPLLIPSAIDTFGRIDTSQ